MIAGPLLYLMNPRLIVITPSPRRSLTPVTLALVALLGVSFTQAQIAPAPKPEVANATVTLTPFTVSAEKDVGFVAASSLAGGRIATALKDTPVAYSVVTAEFLEYSRLRGNDLSTPMPAYGFSGLQPGDCWCLCAERWKEALADGMAPPVKLAGTHAKTLEFVSLEALKAYALDLA